MESTAPMSGVAGETSKIRARVLMRELIPFVVTTIVVRAAQETASAGTGAGTGSTGSNGSGATKDDKVGMQVIEEGILTLKNLAVGSSDAVRPGIVSIMMSTVVPLLQAVDSHGSSSKAMMVHTLALNNVLALGTQFPTEFRYGLAGLSVERRTRLETAIRQSVLQQQQQQQKQQEREQREQERQARERDRVKIELKSSFAGFT